MKRKERVGQLGKRIRTAFGDRVFRTFLSSTLSFFVTAAFAGYHLFLGIAYRTAWNFCIAVYYALLTAIRAYILFSEKKLRKSEFTLERKDLARRKLYLVQSVFLFAIDLALIAPISLMVMQKKLVDYSTIPAITMATYTTYKIIISARSYLGNKKQRHLSVQMLKIISFVDALVSVLTLQYTLIMTFGNGIEGDMLTLCAVSSFAIWGLLIAVSVHTLVKAVRLRRS